MCDVNRAIFQARNELFETQDQLRSDYLAVKNWSQTEGQTRPGCDRELAVSTGARVRYYLKQDESQHQAVACAKCEKAKKQLKVTLAVKHAEAKRVKEQFASLGQRPKNRQNGRSSGIQFYCQLQLHATQFRDNDLGRGPGVPNIDFKSYLGWKELQFSWQEAGQASEA